MPLRLLYFGYDLSSGSISVRTFPQRYHRTILYRFINMDIHNNADLFTNRHGAPVNFSEVIGRAGMEENPDYSIAPISPYRGPKTAISEFPTSFHIDEGPMLNSIPPGTRIGTIAGEGRIRPCSLGAIWNPDSATYGVILDRFAACPSPKTLRRHIFPTS